ncbi:MAG: ComF family protein [Balneolaceae bacterium]
MIKKLLQSIIELPFPQVCVCCGNSINIKKEYICYLCKMKRFESANDEDLIILPDKIAFQFAMWRFDKGGYLQLLLHKLKYDYLKDVGEQMGKMVGEKLLNSHYVEVIDSFGFEPIIVPVPLHPSKKRKRGYNQARSIGVGLAEKTGWELIGNDVVKRIRKTTTQTGLDSNQRTKNLEKAFSIINDQILMNRFPIIVDDVFTTGATTFELADELIKDTDLKAGIVTIAIA